MYKSLIIFLIVLFTVPLFAQPDLMQDSETHKYGFTDATGDWIIQPQYEEGEDFFDNEFTFVKKGKMWGLINRKGETVLPFVYNRPGNSEYEDDLIPVSKSDTKFGFFGPRNNTKHGMVNKIKGIEVIPCIYNKPLKLNEDFFWVNKVLILAVKDWKAGLIDREGNVIIDFAYDVTERPFTPYESLLKAGTIQAFQNKKMGMLDTAGNVLVAFQYDHVEPRYEDGDTLLFDVKNKDKYGLYSAALKKEVIPPLYDDPISFDETGLAIVSRKKKYGIVNPQGKEVMPCTGTLDEAYTALEKLTAKPEGGQ